MNLVKAYWVREIPMYMIIFNPPVLRFTVQPLSTDSSNIDDMPTDPWWRGRKVCHSFLHISLLFQVFTVSINRVSNHCISNQCFLLKLCTVCITELKSISLAITHYLSKDNLDHMKISHPVLPISRSVTPVLLISRSHI